MFDSRNDSKKGQGKPKSPEEIYEEKLRQYKNALHPAFHENLGVSDSTLPIPSLPSDVVTHLQNRNPAPSPFTKPAGKEESCEALPELPSFGEADDPPTVPAFQLPSTDEQAETDPKDFYLLAVAGGLSGQIFRIHKRLSVLGRSRDCDICLLDEDISRVHAQITILPKQEVFMSDLKSTNGTFVNGVRIQECLIKEGDRIQVGRSTILKFSGKSEFQQIFHQRSTHDKMDEQEPIHERKCFDEWLNIEYNFAKLHRTPLSIFLVELEELHTIDSQIHYEWVQKFYQEAAQIIRDVFRREDTLSHYGEHSFGIIACGLRATQAAILGERLRARLEFYNATMDGGRVVSLRASIGLTTMFTQSFHSGSELLQQADEYLFQAKRNGGNQVVAEDLQKPW